MVKRIAWFVPLLTVLALLPFLGRQPADAAACHPALKKLTLSPTSVPGGAPTKATVTLTCATPAALTVHLKGFRGVTTPPTVRVARHKSSATTTIKTSVTTRTRHGTIEATLRQTHRKAALTVTRTPRTCRTPALTGFSTPSLVYVGGKPTATVRLSCAPKAAVRVWLKSSNADLHVPASVTVARYYKTATVPLTPKDDQAGQYQATLTASYRSTAKHGTVTVDPGMSLFEIPPASEPNFADPEVLFTGIIPSGGLTVKFSSDNPAVTVPASYTFPAGAVGGDVPGVTVQPVTKNTKVTLTATFGGRKLTTSTVLLPPFNSSDSITVSAEAGPGPIYGQEFDLEYVVTLSNPAGPDGETVTFSSPDPSLKLQQTTETITPGFDDTAVDIDTANVTHAVHTELDATVDGVKGSLPVVIEPGLVGVSNVPPTIKGGDSFTAMVSLAGPVDTATTVQLQSSWGILTTPSDVVIPAGQSSASFPVTTVAVDSDSDVNIDAFLGTTEVFSSTVTLTP